MDYELLKKMKIKELKYYLKMSGLKVTRAKRKLVAEYLLPVKMEFNL